MGGLYDRMLNLVQVSDDPLVAAYVATNLDARNLDRECSMDLRRAHQMAIQRLRTLNLISRANKLTEPKIDLLLAMQRVPGKSKIPLAGLPNMPMENLLGQGNRLNKGIDQKALLRDLFTNEIEAIRFQTGIVKEMEKYDFPELTSKMRDPNPLIRWLAIQSASQRRLHCEDELIQRLKDPVPAVRAAAHDALVRITRGADFGPTYVVGPTVAATMRAQEEAVAQWRQWLKSQDDTPPGTEERRR